MRMYRLGSFPQAPTPTQRYHILIKAEYLISPAMPTKTNINTTPTTTTITFSPTTTNYHGYWPAPQYRLKARQADGKQRRHTETHIDRLK